MPDFITTKGIAYHIEEIVKHAEKEVTLVTPFLKITPLLLERIIEHDQKGLSTTIIYGKAELRNDQQAALDRLKNLNLYFAQNLHAKSYYNEKAMVITSMNLYEFSENNNREFGVYIDAQKERKFYADVLKEVESIKHSAILHKQAPKQSKDAIQGTPVRKYGRDEYVEALYRALRTKSSDGIIKKVDCKISIPDFQGLNIDYSNSYGFATIEMQNFDKIRFRNLKNELDLLLDDYLKGYRVYWSSPFDRISLYHSKEIQFTDVQDDVDYCIQGIDSLVEFMLARGMARKKHVTTNTR